MSTGGADRQYGCPVAPAPTPRLYCIPATAAPIVAVIRRGPSEWAHIGRWDTAAGTYEPGAWLHGRIYPERCDLSPDGRWLAYFTLRARTGSDWESGDTYIAISRLPWLKALAAWGTCGTWTRGVHFVDDRRVWDLGEPTDGDAGPLRRVFGMRVTAPLAFANEHRRGWSETDDSPPRDTRGAWDEQIDGLTMRKPRPGSASAVDLTARGYYAAFRSKLPNDDFDFAYEIRTDDSVIALPDVQWADWATDGRLLVATTDGRLQVRTGEPAAPEILWEADLARLDPDPQPPPSEASRW
jgi:hypothetical protein